MCRSVPRTQMNNSPRLALTSGGAGLSVIKDIVIAKAGLGVASQYSGPNPIRVPRRALVAFQPTPFLFMD